MFRGEGGEESAKTGISVRAALGVALALLVAIRLVPFGSVFRGGDVVLLSNDPYVFLYLVERALTEGAISRADPTVNWRAEPLLIWTLAFFSLLLGGVEQADFVLAWYPVVTALVSGILVFVLARTLTDDVRIALTAVVVLAVTPLHASRTALGFADHHAFDYMWLLLTATAFTWLVVRTDAQRRRRWQIGGVLGIAIAAQALTWRVSPLMIVPTAGAFGVASLIVARTDAPTRTLAPVVGGFGLAAVLTQIVHQTLLWQNTVVAGTPVLLFLGGVAVLGLVEAIDRVDRSWPALLGAEVAAVALVVVLVWVTVPGFVGEALGRLDAFNAYIDRLQTSGIGEATSLTEAFGPVLGPLILLGFTPFLGLPVAAWGLLRGWREREPAWFVLAAYVAWFLGLAFIQRRWAVQLGLFLSVFAAIGFIAFAHWLALVFEPMFLREEERPDQETIEPPDRTRITLLAGLGAVGIGGGSIYSGYILSQVSIDDAAYRAATWIRSYAEKHGLEYPRNYVLAHWGRVRMYNYLINGESRSYWYARNNYEDFIFSSDGARWYEQFRGRVGFVVTRDLGDETSPFRLHSRLHEQYGSASSTTSGVGHYRAMWESTDGSAKVFRVVAGATITGEGPPESQLALSTPVTISGTGQQTEYQRRAETDADGTFSVTLAQPGEYEVTGADTGETLTVDEATVLDGGELTLRL